MGGKSQPSFYLGRGPGTGKTFPDLVQVGGLIFPVISWGNRGGEKKRGNIHPSRKKGAFPVHTETPRRTWGKARTFKEVGGIKRIATAPGHTSVGSESGARFQRKEKPGPHEGLGPRGNILRHDEGGRFSIEASHKSQAKQSGINRLTIPQVFLLPLAAGVCAGGWQKMGSI